TTFEGFSAQGGPAPGWDFSGFSNQGVNFEDLFRDGFSAQGGPASGWDFSDIFSAFGGSSRSARRKERGKDILVDMEITLEDAFSGIEREIDLKKMMVCPRCKGTGGEPGSGKKKCPDCDGSGQTQQTKRTIFGTFSQISTCAKCEGSGEVHEKECKECRGAGRVQDIETIKVDLPAGVDNGQTIKISGKGEVAKKGGINGDLYIKVHLKPHKVFTRKRDDIYVDTEIKFSQAVLGGKIEIPTLDGDLKLKIPAGTESGQLFRLKAKGMPRLNGYGRGDEYVKINIKVPKKLSRKEEELIEKLKEEVL
ncbi:MAG: DnaJ C-terminal domain-containing protein, partial [bacterium]|nr:DnaJ C-terminal domain-containing protein [bacterium]